MNELLQMVQSFCEKLLQQKKETYLNQQRTNEMSIQEMEDLKQHYLDELLSLSNDLWIKDYRNEKIDICFRRECEDMIDGIKGKFNGMSIEINKKKELQRDDVELLLHHDPSTLKMSVASILEGFTDEPPLEENNDLFDLESKKND
uniref:Uncharacterized protein n=1 Tax=Tanacetum cinerariifolium TaxID=118510 RepID=A0A699H723_TANCI|nr:hypothetical protein [Tanacetum cinerariifolium]